jgi:SAM-dependent methyltransferase
MCSIIAKSIHDRNIYWVDAREKHLAASVSATTDENDAHEAAPSTARRSLNDVEGTRKPRDSGKTTCHAAPVNRDQISSLAHADHPLASPLDDASVLALLNRAIVRGDERVLDLGCGAAEWLLRALVARPGLHAEGVDTSVPALEKARHSAARLGVADRLVLHQQDAVDFHGTHSFDVVLCSGSTHIFGGLMPTLTVALEHLAPGGRVLIGDGFWAGEPSAEAVEMIGDFDDLATLTDRVISAGWTPVGGHISTRRELDDYEWAWTGSLATWALEHPDDPDHEQALTAATTHRREWLAVYRDTFGYVCLVLRRTPDQSLSAGPVVGAGTVSGAATVSGTVTDSVGEPV